MDAFRVYKTGDDLRASLFHYRSLVARRYEADRLVQAALRDPELASWAGSLFEHPIGTRLRRNYERPSDGGHSVIRKLYEETRHRSRHVFRVGSNEVREVLESHRKYPARMIMEVREGRLRSEYQWAQAVSARDIFGDPADPQFRENMERRSAVVAEVVSDWTMVAQTVLTVYVKHQGIETDRLGDFDTEAIQAAIRAGREGREGRERGKQ